MNVFGKAHEDYELTDQVEEYDTLNDETFGVEVSNEEWELEHLSEETEANNAAVSVPTYSKSIPRLNDDGMAMLEESILNLVDDDDDDHLRSENVRRSNTKSNELVRSLELMMGYNTQQAPIADPNKLMNIWQASAPQPNNAPELYSLLSQLCVNNQNKPMEPQQVLVKGAKTAEELEAEMLGKTLPPPMPKPGLVKSCQELEREMLESSRMPAPQIPNVPPPFSMMPSLNFLLNSSNAALAANPQLRAALLAPLIAANPGLMPPPWFRAPPPPMMPPPRGFGPPLVRPGNSPNMPFSLRHRDANMNSMTGQRPVLFPYPPKIMKRYVDNGQRFGNNYDERERFRDPYAGLMTRRERSWLIKVQTLQLQADDTYAHDFYWKAYQRRKLAAAYSDEDGGSRNNRNGNLEPRVYVPPSFEGTLGKVQVLSANFPRQVIDLTAGETKNLDEESSRDSPHVKPNQSSRRLKHTLMEIENLYSLILEAEELLTQSSETADDNSELDLTKRASGLLSNASSILVNDRLPQIVSVRKGRRLFSQLTSLCEKEDCLKLILAVLRNLPTIIRKECCQEVLRMLQQALNKKFPTMNSTEWSTVWLAIKAENMEAVLKNMFSFVFILELVQRCAEESASLSSDAATVVASWAQLIGNNTLVNSVDDSIWKLDPEQASSISQWLQSRLSLPEATGNSVKLLLTKS